MPTFVSPGVYLQELDYSAYAAQVAGSVIAIVGTASQGPVGVPTLLTSPTQAVGIFGMPLPTIGTQTSFGLHAAMNALNQTNEVWFTRVTDGTEKTALASAPIVINNQIVWQVDDSEGISVLNGVLAFTLQVFKAPGTGFSPDAFNALVRQFGAKNVIDATYAPITSQAALQAAIAGAGAFAMVKIPMAGATQVFGNLSNFISRFNALMVDAPLRMNQVLMVDNVNGTTKFCVLKTQNLSALLALNFQFKIVDDVGQSPVGNGFAHLTLSGGALNDSVHYVSKNPGLVQNGIEIVYANVGNTFSGIPTVVVNGNVITVQINAGVTTANDVIAAIGNSSAARLLVVATNDNGSNGTGVVNPASGTLTGGASNLPAQMSIPTLGVNHDSSTLTQVYSNSGLTFEFEANSPGSFANNGTLTFSHDALGLEQITYTNGQVTPEVVSGLVVQPSGTPGSIIDAVANMTNVGAFMASDYTLLSDPSSLALGLGGIDTFNSVLANKTFLQWNAYELYEAVPAAFSGGLAGIPDDYNDLVEAVIGNPANKSGLYAYANRTLYDNSLLAAPGFDQAAVIATGLSIAQTAGDMLYIADSPMGPLDSSGMASIGLTVQEVVDWSNGNGYGNTAAFNSSYGAVYHSWMLIQDPFNGVQHWVPESVCVLEQIAYSDNNGQVWFAPAGFKRGIITRALNVQAGGQNDQGDRDYMYSNGNAVNPIVNFPKDGIVIFGQRTLQRAASALDRINVRRMMNFVKRAAAGAVMPELFDPADPITFKELTNLISPIFGAVQNARGINKFEVKIDSTTTTNADLDNSTIVGYIVIEPTKAAEIIILNFVITAQGASFSEALAAAGVA